MFKTALEKFMGNRRWIGRFKHHTVLDFHRQHDAVVSVLGGFITHWPGCSVGAARSGPPPARVKLRRVPGTSDAIEFASSDAK